MSVLSRVFTGYRYMLKRAFFCIFIKSIEWKEKFYVGQNIALNFSIFSVIVCLQRIISLRSKENFLGMFSYETVNVLRKHTKLLGEITIESMIGSTSAQKLKNVGNQFIIR